MGSSSAWYSNYEFFASSLDDSHYILGGLKFNAINCAELWSVGTTTTLSWWVTDDGTGV